jgi:hypothetical protein
MGEENNSNIPVASSLNEPVATPLAANPVQNYPVTPQPTIAPNLSTPKKPKHKHKILMILVIVFLLLFFAGSVYGAYRVGKGHKVVIIKAPTAQPINLPPQAVVLADCVIGRGKQYILPKDIPAGPIYDVENNKVIAVEYSLNINSIQSNPEYLSDAILKLTRDYPVDHFSLVPVAPKQGQSLSDFHLIMFIVTKAESAKITCKDGHT